ncbi:MAG: sulfotransferase [Candidatus Poribacteria bacterium]|nr:sulfotransferase [Candidatus Poribacteria bacterium]
MINPESYPIIVLGVERSGTSVVAEMLHRWGAYAGPSEKLHKADRHAPRGYWEFLPLWDLLAELGDFEAGATWWDRHFQRQMEKKAANSGYRTKATELMTEMYKSGPWFWKDPALSHFLPFWKRIWDDAIYIITVRHPLDTAVSWQKFIMPANVPVRISFVAMNLLRWQHMMTLILQHTEDAQHKLFLGYEDIMCDPRAQAERLACFLNSKFGQRDSSIQAMVDIVEPRLWRNNCGIPFNQALEATAEQKALYTFARQKIENPLEPFDVAKYPLPPGYLDFLNIQEALLKTCHRLEASTNT